ncbi:MarR family winged helix-turn-helix transcriptional regulator [Paenibacillus solisilvae]|uniref:MarR family winged helix-turn-helix transcriptional regulator n=1 Tax=Paenibacillus solisilvae TaxID=2486751 RepID=A0ABW0W2E9_9BACL
MAYNTELLDVAGLFRTLIKNMTQEWNKHMSYGLSYTQFKVLFKLHSCGSLKVSELAESLGLTSGAITGISDKMIAEGYVERSRAEDDRRVVYIEITSKGEQMLDRVLNDQKDTMTAFFDRLPAEDIQHLKRIFAKMLERINE